MFALMPSREIAASTARVFDAVRIDGCAMRAEVVVATGLAKALVSERLRSLIEWGLIVEGGSLASRGGRPAQRLSVAAGRGYVLATEIGMTHVSVAAADLAGQIRSRRSAGIDLKAGPSEVCGSAVALLRELNEVEDGRRHGVLLGVGVGVAAPVEFATGRTISPPVSPNWHNFPVRDHFATAFGVPAWADNEVNLMALAESRVGAAVGHDNTLTFKLGSWIGAGLVSNGRLHRGAQGCAGSLVSRAGGEALEHAAVALARSGGSPGLAEALAEQGQLTVQVISKVAAAGDAGAARLLDEAALDVGKVMSVVVDFFNPSLVVLAGGMAHGGETFLARVRETVYGSAISLATRDLQIVQSALGDDSGVTGAALMTLDGLFAADALPDTLERLGVGVESEQTP
jgi:predicted NBD/HSP70 family sugar kinase